MLAQINDGCAICRLIAQCVDPQIALRDLQITLHDRQIVQIHRLRLTYIYSVDRGGSDELSFNSVLHKNYNS